MRKNKLNRLLLFFVSCGFIGFFPYLPGTAASLFGCVILYLFNFESLLSNVIFLVFFVLLSVFSINIFTFEGKDPRYIVIDELSGMFITMAGHKPQILNLTVGFILFRFFDIVKPYPIKKVEKFKKGIGIVADDVLAGIFANACLCIFIYLKGIFP